MKSSNVTGPRRSVKIATVATAVGLVGLGTGVSLASTGDPIAVQRVHGAQRAGGAANAGAVTCITEVDANAQAGAFTAATDLFPPGTSLHVASGLSAADVVVSGALNANAGNANNGGNNKRRARRNRGNNANAGNANANAGNANANGANDNRRVRRNRGNNANAGNNAGNANAGSNANGNAGNNGNTGNAGNNDGVDPNSVCVNLSKAPFDKLSDNGNGENVNTFVVTMTPLGGGGQAGRRQ